MFECPEPNCGKKYKQMNGLKYHRRNAHQDAVSHVSDSLSETEKLEPMSSPDETKRPKRKSRSESAKSSQTTSEFKSKESKEPETCATTASSEAMVTQTNTTSVITPTTTQITNSNQQLNVPVAAITPQVVKPTLAPTPAAEEVPKSIANQQAILSSGCAPIGPSSRPLPSTPKLVSKSSSNSMAPISTITSQGVFNPSLKPIQPKPTILGESFPSPALTDLRDHKKLKRKRSASRDDLTTVSGSPLSDITKPNGDGRSAVTQQPGGCLPRISLPEADSQTDKSISDGTTNGKAVINDSLYSPCVSYPVATVSPQKNIPASQTEKAKPATQSASSPSTRPLSENKSRREAEVTRPTELDFKQRESEILLKQFGHFKHQMAGWTHGMPIELFQQMMATRDKHGQSASPRSSVLRGASTTQSKELDMRVSTDRLQFLKENVGLKPQGPIPSYSASNDMPRDYSLPSKANEELDKLFRIQSKKEKDSLQIQSSGAKPGTSLPRSLEHKVDLSRLSHASMIPPGSFTASYMSNPLLAYPGLTSSSVMYPGRPLDLLHTAGVAMDLQFPNMPDMKDSHKIGSSPHISKSEHKIHELESMKTKSPRSNPHLASEKNKSRPSVFNPFINPFAASGKQIFIEKAT